MPENRLPQEKHSTGGVRLEAFSFDERNLFLFLFLCGTCQVKVCLFVGGLLRGKNLRFTLELGRQMTAGNRDIL